MRPFAHSKSFLKFDASEIDAEKEERTVKGLPGRQGSAESYLVENILGELQMQSCSSQGDSKVLGETPIGPETRVHIYVRSGAETPAVDMDP
jgi:hypothetical protein